MTDSTPRLSLPYIQPAQAQKHVTHNEALKVLDAVTQLAVQSSTLTVAPATPAAGDCHLVGAGAGGIWAGLDGQIAVFDGLSWSYVIPRQGWRADVAADGRALRFNGSAWVDAVVLQNLDSLGIATTADSTNRLAVASDAVLLTHQGAGHQLKINKFSPGDTASLLFQTNWSGRAEFGTTGSDDFAIKVSADGNTYHEAIRVEGGSGAVRVPSGQHYFREAQIANDGVHSFDIPWSDPARILLWLSADVGGHFALLSITGTLSGAGNFTTLFAQPSAMVSYYTGPLSGTTGATGGINLSIDTASGAPRLYIENRLGASHLFTLSTIGR